jgi:hypothetical protein
MYRFMTPSRSRKEAETEEPMIPPMWEKLSNLLETADAVAATMMDVMMTIVEWPREKKVPTVTGLWPAARRRLVIRSMADIWSASKACLNPRTHESKAVEISALRSPLVYA